MLYCFYFSDTEAFEACFRLLHDDDDAGIEALARARKSSTSTSTSSHLTTLVVVVVRQRRCVFYMDLIPEIICLFNVVEIL